MTNRHVQLILGW